MAGDGGSTEPSLGLENLRMKDIAGCACGQTTRLPGWIDVFAKQEPKIRQTARVQLIRSRCRGLDRIVLWSATTRQRKKRAEHTLIRRLRQEEHPREAFPQ